MLALTSKLIPRQNHGKNGGENEFIRIIYEETGEYIDLYTSRSTGSSHSCRLGFQEPDGAKKFLILRSENIDK